MLVSGTRLGPYEIQSLLGAGGMGEVYRARDIRLDRAVAVKVVPASLSSNSTSRQRFQREARAISLLQHPNICTLYDVGQQDETDYLVMEYLEGETLATRLTKTRLTGQQILDYGIEIANALDAAHDRGIVHRDLKPGNIFITSRGECKVLDFGLALIETEASMDAPTLTRPEVLTSPGAALGTVAYMSPEQARGESLNACTDLFSLGTVLYEMATGKLPFAGKTSAVVFKAILDHTPSPPSQLNKSLPDGFDQVIGKALEKDRDLRYHSAADMRADLKRIKRDRESQRLGAISKGGGLVQSTSPRSRWMFPSVVAVVLVAAASLVAYHWFKPTQAQVAFEHYRITPLTSTGNIRSMDLSRDGRYLGYVAEEDDQLSIWIQQIATSTNVRVLGPLPNHALLRGVRFSPDGNYIYYHQQDEKKNISEIYRLPAVGGTAVKILSDVDEGLSFSPDGSKIGFARYVPTVKESRFILTDADGANEKPILTLKQPQIIWQAAWSPDGRILAVGIDEQGIFGDADSIAIVSAQGGPERRIVHRMRIEDIAWLADSSGLFVSSAGPEYAHRAGAPFQLWTVSVPEGRIRRITNDLNEYRHVRPALGAKILGASQQRFNSSIWLASAAIPSQITEIASGAGNIDGLDGLAWLPDGRLLYGSSQPIAQIWAMNRDGTRREQLTHTSFRQGAPAVTADGRTLLFFGAASPWLMNSDGHIHQQGNSGWCGDISPDGKFIVFHNQEGVKKVVLQGGDAAQLDDDSAGCPSISPDGHWIAFPRFDAAKNLAQLKIVAADGSGSVRLLPFLSSYNEIQVPGAQVNSLVFWTASSDALTFVRTKNGVSNLWRTPIKGGPSSQITNFTSGLIWDHAWSRDGKYLALAKGTVSNDAILLTDLR
jgi:eukaryotic-like serine/threonine-protein kinase